MAGVNDHIKQGGSFYNKNSRVQYSPHRNSWFILQPPTSEGFKQRQRKEFNRLELRSVDTLRKDIFRIFSESLHCDLHILIEFKVIRTNQCILRTRSPIFYKIIEPNFDYSKQTTSCYLDTPGFFHQIDNFVRLLYSNSEVSQEERSLVQLILSVTCEFNPAKLSYSNAISNDAERDYKDSYQECNATLRHNERGDSIDAISTSSEMADSGLETGSASPQETTVSENSVTEFEESQEAEYTSMDEDFSKITSDEVHEPSSGTIHFAKCCYKSRIDSHDGINNLEPQSQNRDATCSSVKPEQQHGETSGSSGENGQIKEESTEVICQYENQVLNDPFYESDNSDDDNQDNSPMPSDSFEFVDPENLPYVDYDSEEKPENYKEFESEESERLRKGEKEKKSPHDNFPQLSRANDSIKSSTTSVNSYFFIDASSLNDDVVPLALGSSQERGDSLPPYFCPSDNYVPSRTMDTTKCDEHEFTIMKPSNSQSEQEEVREFKQELKLNEFLKPVFDVGKVKRVDSTFEEKLADRGTVKEALVVEIKEADSGESTQPSPCPDNTKIDVADGVQISNEIIKNKDGKANEKTSEENRKTTAASEDGRPSLIRRNTFELDTNDEKLSVLRQEYERRQGSLVFQNSIPQYSGHRVDDDSCYGSPMQSSLVPINDPMDEIVSQVACETNYQNVSLLSFNKFEQNNTESEKKCNYFFSRGYDQSEIAFPVQKSASDKNLSNSQEDDISENCNSLPVTLNNMLTGDNREDSMRRSARDQVMSIVLGESSSSDFTKPMDSPGVCQKTESTPIVSVGSVFISGPEPKIKPRMSSSMNAWVVDMSMSTKTIKSNSPGMSQSFSTSDCLQTCLQTSTKNTKTHEKLGSFGFFVDLSDMKPSKEKKPQQNQPKKREPNGTGKPYCEFFIDMSDNDASVNEKKQEPKASCAKKKSIDSNDKKNIFSMFIDFKEPRKSRESLPDLYKKTLVDRETERSSTEETSITTEEDERQVGTQESNHETPVKEKNKGVFMFIQSDSPVVRRKTLSSSRAPFKRHSWNTDKSSQDGNENDSGSANSSGHMFGNGIGTRNGTLLKPPLLRKEHKRAQSLSIDRKDLRKFQGRTSNSSHSLSEAARVDPTNERSSKLEENSRNMDTSSEEVFEYDIRDTPPNSHIEIINEEIRMSVKHDEFQGIESTEIVQSIRIQEKNLEDESSEIWDKTGTESTEGQTRKSETFDISSGSGLSPGSENRDFELAELLNGEVPNLVDRTPIIAPTGAKIFETHKSLNEKIKRIESELKGPEFRNSSANYKSDISVGSRGNTFDPDLKQKDETKSLAGDFVRLSDLDSTPTKCSTSNVTVIKESEAFTHRMSNSIPETSWIESKLMITRTNGPIRTRSRQFSSHMSTSLPPKQKSPLEELTGERDVEGIISESDISSMQSSMGRSGAEGSTEETETSSFAGTKPYNRLGEDLLRMFLEEINPDVTIDVAGRKIRAHKCILSSRCQYFAAILSGGWIESTGNIISLQGYSYNAVHFALCHIYSGESNIPDTVSIMELATLADMLCLEGLKEVIGYTLKVKYCHLFHKPCQVCAVGVLECMPLAAAYGLDELYRKSLKWVTRHFVRIWPCKAFATLPRELMEKCYHQHIVHMSPENVLQTLMDCDKLLATLPNVRWAESVFRLVSDLLDISVKYLSDNFTGVLSSESFQGLGQDLTWNISRLEDNFLLAAERLPPDQACKSYARLHKVLAAAQLDDSQLKDKWGPLFIEFLKRIQNRVEKCLIREAARASRTTTWLKMDLELRRRIQELACLVILPNDISKRQSRHSNFLKEAKIPPSRFSANRSLDIKRVKTAITEYNGKTIKSTTTTQQTKRVFSKPKTDPLERKVQEEKPTTDGTLRPKSWPNKVEVKSRYLEPRNKSVTKPPVQANHEKSITQRKKIMISSSDSSRTSSPAMKRAMEKKPISNPKIKLQARKDVKALSSDSLTDSNATRITKKKEIISKSCGITRPESPSFKRKNVEVALSVDSLADQKKKHFIKKVNKMDTSISTDSLMTEVTGTPKSTISNKISPTLNRGLNKSQIYDRTKKSSPPTQSKNPVLTRRLGRSLENSTTSSRNRTAAANPYHASPSLRRNLLDAAKTPDIPTKSFNNVAPRTITRHTAQSAAAAFNAKRDKKDSLSNSIDSPGKRTSPKLNATHKLSKSVVASKPKVGKGTEDKSKSKAGAPKLLTVGSRSGTFLKDEPTILKKADIKSAQIDT